MASGARPRGCTPRADMCTDMATCCAGRGRGLVAEVEIPIAETLLVCEPVGAGAPGGPQVGPGAGRGAHGRDAVVH